MEGAPRSMDELAKSTLVAEKALVFSDQPAT